MTEELCPVMWSSDHRRHACVQHQGNVHMCVCNTYKIVREDEDAQD